MKNIVLSSVVVALLVFSGCSSKKPTVDENKKAQSENSQNKNAEEVKAVETEIVATEDSVIDTSSEEANKLAMAEIQAQLSSVYFAYDQFVLDSKMKSKVKQAITLGKEEAQSFNIKLEGNCDEWGSDEYNFALGLKRAYSVKKAIVAEGIDSSRISMVSYGESNPVCSEKTQDCWAKNRRVDFRLLP